MHKLVSQNSSEVTPSVESLISAKNAPVVAESLLHLLSQTILVEWNPGRWDQNLLMCAFISRKWQHCQQLGTTNNQREKKRQSRMFIIFRGSSGNAQCQGNEHCNPSGNVHCIQSAPVMLNKVIKTVLTSLSSPRYAQ